MAVSDDLQMIPARHGTATFVPKGATIKIVNSSGTQVIDTWAFALPNPPKKPKSKEDEQKDDKGSEDERREQLEKAAEEEKARQQAEEEEKKKKQMEEEEKARKEQDENNKKAVAKKGNKKSKDGLDLPSQEDAEKATSQQQQQAANEAQKGQQQQQSTPTKGGWTSYLPSLRGRKQVTDGGAKEESSKEEPKAESKASVQQQQKENSKTWGSYFVKGQAVTSYLPSKGAISAFAASHARDTSKTYAEQLADFSKTPVGAASISALTGSGTASSLYAGYSAWSSTHGDQAQDEYLSMPHTRASTCHMTPRVNDVLVSNLRQPMLTLVEDTSPGVHDTLMAACDPQRYKGLNVEDWEQHGSCAENLVLALKELNDRAGLKGPKGVGAAVTVNSVPAPLNLFMNIPWKGDKGDLSFEAPKCSEGDYVRFRAERDVVVIMSACPQDVLDINTREPKDGHFVVEHAESDSSEDEAAAETKKPEPKKKERAAPKKLNSTKKMDKAEKAVEEKPTAKKMDKPAKAAEEQKAAENVPLPATPAVEKPDTASTASSSSAAPKPKGKPRKLVDATTGEKKKPRKLERRVPAAASTPASGSATPKDKDADATAGAEKNKGGS